MQNTEPFSLFLDGPDATDRLGEWFSRHLTRGDVFLLSGDVGAGKTHFARALIQSRLARDGVIEDVPSPTFTLVQTYETDGLTMFHADLYRLSSVDELEELGLLDAFSHGVAIVEWPERLGQDRPDDALSLAFRPTRDGASREVTLTGGRDRWAHRLALLRGAWTA